MSNKLSVLVFFISSFLHGDFVPLQISESPRIFMLYGFLTHEECDHMIDCSRSHLIASKVVDEKSIGEVTDIRRNSLGVFLSNNGSDPLLIGIEKRIGATTGMPIENGEDLHVLYYGVGGEYQPHYDYFNVATPGGAECVLRGGQRVASLIMYLNTPDAGGETVFPIANIFIPPRKGDAILFYNCTPDGKVDPSSLHGGAQVVAGEKWIMTKWIRERAFR